jgi:transposase
MISLSHVRIFLYTQPTSMNHSFDRLMGLARETFGQDPLSGHLFLFLNRERDRLKILFWDRDGWAVFDKRLERGTFQLPKAANGKRGFELEPSQFLRMLDGLDLTTGRRRKRYRRRR